MVIFLKGDKTAEITLALADGFDYSGKTLHLEYQGVRRSFANAVAGGTLTFSFSAAETAPMSLGAYPVRVWIEDAQGEKTTIHNSAVKLRVTDCATDIHAESAIYLDVRGGLYGIDGLPPRFTENDLRGKINEILRRLGGTVAMLLLCALPAFAASLTVETAPKGEIYNDEAVVTNVTLDVSDLATSASLNVALDVANAAIATNAADIATNADAIAVNAASIATNSARIATKADAIKYVPDYSQGSYWTNDKGGEPLWQTGGVTWTNMTRSLHYLTGPGMTDWFMSTRINGSPIGGMPIGGIHSTTDGNDSHLDFGGNDVYTRHAFVTNAYVVVYQDDVNMLRLEDEGIRDDLNIATNNIAEAMELKADRFEFVYTPIDWAFTGGFGEMGLMGHDGSLNIFNYRWYSMDDVADVEEYEEGSGEFETTVMFNDLVFALDNPRLEPDDPNYRKGTWTYRVYDSFYPSGRERVHESYSGHGHLFDNPVQLGNRAFYRANEQFSVTTNAMVYSDSVEGILVSVVSSIEEDELNTVGGIANILLQLKRRFEALKENE